MSVFSSFLIGMTILFGIIAQMLLLDIHIKNLKGSLCLFFVSGNLLVLAVNMVLSRVLSAPQHMKIYVLVIHVPIFLIFLMTTKLPPIKIAFALFTAVFMIYPANIVLTIVTRTIKWLPLVGYFIFYTIVCAIILFMIHRFFKTNFNYLIKNYSGFSFIKLCLLPLTYNIGNFWLGMYNYATVMPSRVLLQRFLLFIITLIAYVLILDIAKSAREKEALQSVKMALSILLESAEQQLSALKATQEQAVIYRHDMRHHLALIGGYLADGDFEKAENYVKLTQSDIEDITPNRYCENNTVNLIMSSFAAKAKSKGVILIVEAGLPKSLSITDTELCALLSNGLENAIEAASQVTEEQLRKVRISCQTHKDNLLIFIENSFMGKLVMEDRLPKSLRKGHGFGIKSMNMIAEKYNGYCSFEAKDEIFTLRIVLPL